MRNQKNPTVIPKYIIAAANKNSTISFYIFLLAEEQVLFFFIFLNIYTDFTIKI